MKSILWTLGIATGVFVGGYIIYKNIEKSAGKEVDADIQAEAKNGGNGEQVRAIASNPMAK